MLGNDYLNTRQTNCYLRHPCAIINGPNIMDVNENVIKYQNIECHSYLESYLAYMVWNSRRVNFFIIFIISKLSRGNLTLC